MNFDYVIVGAGSAGCVLANRLSSSGQHSVLALEAGGSDRKFWIQTPIGYGKTFYDERVNWAYQSEPQKDLDNRVSYWPRGKVIGGSSSINAMVYIRGQQADYNDWLQLGNNGWGWNDVLPYFIKSETNSEGGDAFRGDSGPLYVNDPKEYYHPLCNTFIETAKQCGYPHNLDFNSGTQEGVGSYQITTKNGFRMSAARAYLRPSLKRKNCDIETNAHVTRILFEGRKVVGVEFLKNGKIRHAHCNKEVIISAGAINSPQLLQLSGVGSAKLLTKHGIKIVHNNEQVGQNLQDHLSYTHYYKSNVPTLNNQLSPWWGKLFAGLQYILLHQGPLSLSVNQAGGFIKSNPNRSRPNLQLYFAPITYTTSPSDERPLMQPDPFPAFLNCVSQCRPTSRGYLEIKSSNPLIYPVIQPNYLTTEHDVQELVEGFEFLRKIASTKPLSDIIVEEMMPGININSKQKIIEDIRKQSSTVFHPVSTCIMGPDPDSSVVGSDLRVHNLENLRIVDASIFPTLISGNTNAPTIMVAEKAADMILKKH